MPDLGIFGLEFENIFVLFEISILEFVFLQSLMQIKILKFGAKNAWSGYFWAGIWKKYCHIWNQLLRMCLIAKFRGKAKMPKFGTKNVLFGYFWAKVWKEFCHIWNQHARVCLIAKLREKMNFPKFGTKDALLEVFLG